MARTFRALPSEDRKALIQRGGARGFHGGNSRDKNRRGRKSVKQSLRGGDW